MVLLVLKSLFAKEMWLAIKSKNNYGGKFATLSFALNLYIG